MFASLKDTILCLYKYNELTKEYEFILHSLYNKDNSMYYVAT